jgi:hypothetical protein
MLTKSKKHKYNFLASLLARYKFFFSPIAISGEIC